MNHASHESLEVLCDEETGGIRSVRLFGRELLSPGSAGGPEVALNRIPLDLRLHPDRSLESREPLSREARFKAERFVDFWAGAGLVVNRSMGSRPGLRYGCFAIDYWIRRGHVDVTAIPYHGPGGPGVEAPLWVDTITALNWNWQFWGDSTRMIYCSTHSNAADHEWTHIGYNHDTPEKVKAFMKNPFRRQYPGTMVIHGGLFYDETSGNWLAITCRRPHLGYMLNIDSAGRGVSYDFTLHAEFAPGENLRLPEVRLYFGENREEMLRWLGEYATFYYEEPPDWVFKTHFLRGLAWDNQPTWSEQADYWERQIGDGCFSGISYSLVTNRPLRSGTSPIGYEPDPTHGTLDDFRRMCLRMADRDVPMLIWLSHTGLLPGAIDVDEDWFIRGIDGQRVASWGSRDSGMCFVNPGHPGYIEYTKRWMDFYLCECRCRGIFFDCYGFSIPPDFTPRPFMRYPGQTALMTIRFMEEVFHHARKCNPEAIIWGEGVSLDGPVHGFSIHANPCRSIDGMGPRDFLLYLGRFAPKRFAIDQGPLLYAASGFSVGVAEPDQAEANRFLTRFLKEHGGRRAFEALPGDVSRCGDILIVPKHGPDDGKPHLAPEIPAGACLVNAIDGSTVSRGETGPFSIPPGIYRIKQDGQAS